MLASLITNSKFLLLVVAFYAFSTNAQGSSIEVSKSCYTSGEDIEITFANANPQQDDWIGVFSSSKSLTSLTNPETNSYFNWIWTCGKRSCTPSKTSSATVTYRSVVATGSWKVILLRNDGEPYTAIAQSSTFVVQSTCSGAPGPSPTTQTSPSVPTPTGAGTTTSNTAATLQAARSDIANMIVGSGGNRKLGPKFLRLGFHDCVGGCDGCVDMTNEENAGLLVPIQALRPIVSKYVSAATGISRADIWALATAVGADVLQSGDRVNFDMLTVGRVDCSNEVGGPDRVLPSMHIRSRDLFAYFRSNFGFSIMETVALMGAHTVGEMKAANSGVDAPNGWVLDNGVLNNNYYHELIGGTSAQDSLTTNIDGAPNWQKSTERNGNGMPNRNVWTGFPGGTKIVLLNADVALVRELNSTNMDANGKVSCNFRQQGRCPVNTRAIGFAVDYTFDSKLWLNDFSDVLIRMVNNGYSKTSKCDGSVCFLSQN